MKRHRDRVTAEDVLAGRVQPDARELLRLIHAVNPTGRDLAKDEIARRYDIKARLQSLLVRHFSGDLDVVADATDPGVVSLRHRYLPSDGCHARVAALDEDARSWVQLQIDLGAYVLTEAEAS